MKKIDFKKELSHLYRPSAKKVETVDVPPMNFLMIDGQGDPNSSPSFHDAIKTLFPLSYALKFMSKKREDGIDYGVMPLEGLWWADDMASFAQYKTDEWKWTLMIMQPEFITGEMVQEAIEQVKAKKSPPSLSLVRFESLEEGESVQIMHIGPYSEEGPTIEKLHSYIQGCGKKLKGRHHEIYLSDARRTAPEKWRTILRQPMSNTHEV